MIKSDAMRGDNSVFGPLGGRRGKGFGFGFDGFLC